MKKYRGKTTTPPKEEIDEAISYLEAHNNEIKDKLIKLANRKY